MSASEDYKMSGDRPSYRSNRAGTQSSSENSDEGEEDTPLWRQKQEKYFRKQKGSPMVLSSSLPEVRTDSVNSQAAQKKKSNNIWGSVLTEQDLTQTLSKSAAVDKPDEILYNERNVESYDFTKKYQDKRRGWDLDDSEAHSADNKTEILESRMITESRPVASRSIIGYEDTLDKSKDSRDLRHNLRRPNNRKRKADSGNDRQQRSGVHDRLGVKKVTTTRLGEIDMSVDMEDSELIKKIAEFLHEPKVELIERVVTHLGKEVAIRIVQATKDVEESGGMYTLDGSRRRTPGGVYLTLMKQQPEFNKDVRKLIFVEDVEEMQKHRKEKRKKAKRRRQQAKKQGNDQKGSESRSRSNSHSRSRSNSNSSSKSTPHKGANAEEAMEDGEVKEETDQKNNDAAVKEHDNKNSAKTRDRKSRKDESSDESSDDYDDDRQKSNWSKPFNFEDELAAAKKLILEKSKSQNKGDNEMMEAGNDEGQGQDKENFSEMADLETAEADVVDIEIGLDTAE
ncbi:phosphorylated adapter RNA export protein-like isoform X2 [Mercenaria mercenaria]|nr:phosphorylated adapter RNA export protein-like isoform X2 [Mercenaria mercenaria]XP_045216920.2 phosphorylated adapter RNA export protein-like isoform X2 [Mercenaria mercenaria]